MKTRLSELTLEEFIKLLEGDTSVIVTDTEDVTDDKISESRSNIVAEYRDISDPAGFKSSLCRAEDYSKTRMELHIFQICKVLIEIGEYGDVREILEEYGLSADTMTEERLKAEVQSGFSRAEMRIAEFEDETLAKTKTSDIRRQFDLQTATLMAHFKFGINTMEIRASVYAQLVARYTREIRAIQMSSRK